MLGVLKRQFRLSQHNPGLELLRVRAAAGGHPSTHLAQNCLRTLHPVAGNGHARLVGQYLDKSATGFGGNVDPRKVDGVSLSSHIGPAHSNPRLALSAQLNEPA
jgi:hypothetical protein